MTCEPQRPFAVQTLTPSLPWHGMSAPPPRLLLLLLLMMLLLCRLRMLLLLLLCRLRIVVFVLLHLAQAVPTSDALQSASSHAAPAHPWSHAHAHLLFPVFVALPRPLQCCAREHATQRWVSVSHAPLPQ